eukprot:2172245-Alexandrium_andersonii.AAC.1
MAKRRAPSATPATDGPSDAVNKKPRQLMLSFAGSRYELRTSGGECAMNPRQNHLFAHLSPRHSVQHPSYHVH